MMMNNGPQPTRGVVSRRDLLTLLGVGLIAGCASTTPDSTQSSTATTAPKAPAAPSTINRPTTTGPTTVPATAVVAQRPSISVDDGNTAVPDPVEGDVESVVIVGAGVAGLVVAQALSTAGIEAVVVEGRDRIGGRIHTVELADTPVDLGALWVHDGQRSPVLDYLRLHSVELLPARLIDIVANATFLDLDSAEFPDDETRAGVLGAVAAFESNAAALIAQGGDVTLEAAIEQTASAASAVDRASLARLLSLFDGGDADDLGLVNFAEFYFTTAAEDDDKLIRGGCQRLVEFLSIGLDIRLSSRVDTIVDNGTTVTVSGPGIDLTASHAVVTIPLGVLKADTVTFQPELPDVKVQAIERLGFGAFEKVALEYPTAFWQTDGATDIIATSSDDTAAWPLIVDMSAWYGRPVVVGLAAGQRARRIAYNPTDINAADLHRAMTVAAGPDTPVPIASLSTAWTNDPFSRGCYTNIKRSSNSTEFLADVTAMAAPHGRILWAGEGTHPVSSTVDGAWLSGVREAKRLLRRDAVDIA